MAYKDPEKQREFQRRWMAKRREEFFRDKMCEICGCKEGLELDHVDPSQRSYRPTALWGMSPNNPKRVAEIDKCQILCHPCHLKKSVKEKVRGENHPHTKFTENDVRFIRSSNLSTTDLMKMFDAPRRTINNIKSYTYWRHLQ